MKFTAIYKTEALHERRFTAESAKEAKNYCLTHFPHVKNIYLISHDDPNFPNFPIHIGDARTTSALSREYHRIKRATNK